MNAIQTIIDKEWNEVFKNRVVLTTILMLPLFFTAMPLIMLYVTGQSGGGEGINDMPAQFSQMCGNLTGAACGQVFIVTQFLMLFMILPIAIPVAISAYSIVGEKTTRCLEPLLATPITTAQLILGKGLAAALPAIAATWGAFAVFARIVDPMWLIAVLVIGPLMAIMAVTFSIIVSSRVTDPRTAEQVSMLIIVPLVGVFLGQMSGLFLLDTRLILLAAVVMSVLDVVLVYLSVDLFQRETILTKWK